MIGNTLRRILLAGGAPVALAAAMAPAPAFAQGRTYELDIPAMDLGDALRRFARTTREQVVFSGDAVRGRRSAAVRGSFTAREGLDRLTGGSGLSIAVGSGGIFMLRAAEAPASGEGDAGSAAAEDGSADQEGVAEILVIGSRSQNVDIRRTEDDAQPYVVFDRTQIETSQASNLEEFFRTQLPMNGARSAASQRAGTSNASEIDLRGLGANQTLILVDGRRAPRVLSGGNIITQADINGIPLAAIERIEILPSTAGGTYGGGAVGGVINIIRRRDYRGVDARFSVDLPEQGGGEQVRFEVTGGFSPNGGSTQISFSAAYSDTAALLVSDNDLWRDGRARFIASNAPELGRGLFSGSTPNIRSQTGAILTLDPRFGGASLGSNHLYVPTGFRGIDLDGVQPLVANAGRYSFELPDDGRGRRQRLRNNPRIWSANANIRQSLGRGFEAFADFSLSENLGRNIAAGPANMVTLAANAPNNPFNQPINVYFPTIGLEREGRSRLQAMSASGGIIASLWRGWRGTAEYSWSRSRSTSRTISNPLNTAATTALRNGVLDVVRDVQAHPLDYSPYLLAAPETRAGPFQTVQQLGSVRLSGPLLRLPGGRATATLLAERRVEDAAEAVTRSPTTTTILPARSQSADSAYAEIEIPFFSPVNAIPLLNALEVQVAARIDRYRTNVASPASYSAAAAPASIQRIEQSFSSTDFTVSGAWSPVADVRLRGSWSTGFLPPSIHQLVPQSFFLTSPQVNITDPLRGRELVGTNASYEYRGNGNPDLEPEQSRSYSFGIVFTPRFLEGFRLSADYTVIRKQGEIGQALAQTILDNEAAYPGRVVRAAARPGDPAGWPGPVILIDESLLNLARSRVAAWDFQVDYRFDHAAIGTLRAFAVFSHQVDRTQQLRPDTPILDLADYGDGPLRWRGAFGLEWRRGPWSANWNAQYYHSYFLRNADPASVDPTPVQGSARIPAQLYNDLAVSYRFERPGVRALNGTIVSLGVVNLFNAMPPPIVQNTFAYSPYGDPRLRRFTLSISRSFGGQR